MAGAHEHLVDWQGEAVGDQPAGVGAGDAIAGLAGDHRGIDADPLPEVLAVEIAGAEHAIETCPEVRQCHAGFWFHVGENLSSDVATRTMQQMNRPITIAMVNPHIHQVPRFGPWLMLAVTGVPTNEAYSRSRSTSH